MPVSSDEFPEAKYVSESPAWSKLVYLVHIVRALPYALKIAVQYWLPGHPRTRPWLSVIFAALNRRVLSEASPTTVQNLSFGPLGTLLESASLRPLAAQTHSYNVKLPVRNATIRWLHEAPSRTSSDPVILYFHGGSYLLKTASAQIEWVLSLWHKLKNKQRVSIAVLDYSTIPYYPYPMQLKEARAAYDYLRQSSNKIVLLGDSAGGHLAASLLLDLKARKIPAPFGAFFVSAATDPFPEETGSIVENQEHDLLPLKFLNWGTEQFAGHAKDDKLANPALASAGDWKGAVPINSGAIWGGLELYRDSCRTFCETAGIKEHFEDPFALHDSMLSGTANDGFRFTAVVLNKWTQ